MPKIVKDELGDIHVVSSHENEELKGDKKSLYAVRVHFANGNFADIAYYEEKRDAVGHCRSIKRESASVIGIIKLGVVELELITKSS
ncbi:MAG: hypothetical protein ACXWMH_05970 [Syntrophales bacterium]